MTDFENKESARAFNRAVVEEFRTNSGRVGGVFEGAKIVLLTTIGAKTGKPRLTPLAYHRIDDRIFVVGSNAGAHIDPGWVRNLRANPLAQVDFGTEDAYQITARELPAEERREIFARVIDLAPTFAKYAENSHRRVPLFEFTRSG